MYDEKQNKVTIKVVSSCPERIMQKIRCKGGKCIMCIEIKKPPKPPPPPVEKPPPPPPPTPPPPPPPCKVPVIIPVCLPNYPFGVCCRPCCEGGSGVPCESHGQQKPEKPEKPPPSPPPPPPPCKVPCLPNYPFGVCCRPSCEGGSGVPCFHSQGQPLPCSCGCGGSRGCYVSRCDYFCEENPSECTFM
jgi:hypothetical protein